MSSVEPRTRLLRRSVLAAGATLPLTAPALAAGAGDSSGRNGSAEPDLKAELPREDPGSATAGDPVAQFSARMLAAIDRADVNAVCSPLSAQIVLTMIGLGAAGDTRAQMEETLGGGMDELAQAANTLTAVLAAVGDEEREDRDDEAPEPAAVSLVNGLWLQQGMTVRDSYLEDLGRYFGSGVFEADFTDDAEREQARVRINDWAAEATQDLIQDLVPQDVLDADSRLVLVNALHLKAAWHKTLSRTTGTFTTADGSALSTELLSGSTPRWYEDDLCRATALETYGDDLSLALVQPTRDLDTVLDAWSELADDDRAGLGALLTGLEASEESTKLTLPGFDIAWDAPLTPVLDQLGMTEALSEDADLSGITGEEDLFITHVLQKAVITVDDEGMEAAAATAAAVGTTSVVIDEHELVLDSPFLVVAYERSTRAPLVLGWIGDPTRTE
ncbi:serpin family protein [Brachybacterium sacelli]|uniref:Serpin B n=1 Tax=Brachybacterium sacelli TaxID=173364 RepID=A0ABS4WYE4_9MICO|nr:serpin family protein [Brachybacterium sacelli]MBP2381230.1 serpin B [Brachybacterium sacelli]